MFLDHFLGENILFHQIDPTNPPLCVTHGWKATDLLYELVKGKNYLLNPISRQNFADAFAVNHNLKLEVHHNKKCTFLNPTPEGRTESSPIDIYSQNVGSLYPIQWILDMNCHQFRNIHHLKGFCAP